MFQSLRQRTFFDYRQKTVDTYCAFILYNMKLSMSESFADYDLPEPEVISVAASHDPRVRVADAYEKAAGAAFREGLVNAVWETRLARKTRARADVV